MKNLPLSSLRALAAAYETGGIRSAGRLLDIAHSAVSHHLKELESWLEVPLFKREAKRGTLAFTAQGERLGRQCLASFRALERSVASTRESHRGNVLTIATTPSFAVRWLLPRLAQFQETHRPIEVSVVVGQQLKSLTETGVDLAIRMGRKPGSGKSWPLMDDTLYPVASPAFLKKLGGQLQDLGTLPLIHDRDPNTPWSRWKEAFGPTDLDTSKGARFTSSDLVLRAAEQGLGVTLARDRLVADSLANGSLVKLFENQHIKLPNAYWVIEREDCHRSAVRRFLEWLRSQSS